MHPLNRTRDLHQLDTFPCGTNGFQVPKSLAHPVNDTTLFLESLNVGPAGYEDGVEHCTSHALEMVVWLNAFPILVLAISKDGLALGTDDERKRLRGFERSHDAVEGDRVVPVRNENGDAAGSDCRLRGVARRHAERGAFLAMIGASRFRRSRCATLFRDGLGETEIDVAQALRHAIIDDRIIAMVQFKRESTGEVGLFGLGLRIVEELGLVEMFAEFLGLQALLDAGNLCGIIDIATFLNRRWGNSAVAVRPVVDFTLVDYVLTLAVALVVHNRANGTVDGKLLPIDAKSGELSVKVREIPALEKRVVREANSRNNVAGTESHLLGLGEILIDIAVELELANISDRYLLFGPDLGSVKNVEFEVILLRFFKSLDAEFPLGILARADGVVEVLTVEVGVLSTDLESFVPHQRVDA